MWDALVELIHIIVVMALGLVGVAYAPDREEEAVARLSAAPVQLGAPAALSPKAPALTRLAIASPALRPVRAESCGDVAAQPAVWRAKPVVRYFTIDL